MAEVKICGVRDAAALRAAAGGGARWAGFVFARSPREMMPVAAAPLLNDFFGGEAAIQAVALCVDPDDALIEALSPLPFSAIQLHGAEPPERCAAIARQTGREVWKAHGVGSVADRDRLAAYAPVCSRLVADARPPQGADRPGGHGEVGRWDLLEGWSPGAPWMLSGGLTPGNVAQGIEATGAESVDVSSGVESAHGVKSPALISAFLRAARAS